MRLSPLLARNLNRPSRAVSLGAFFFRVAQQQCQGAQPGGSALPFTHDHRADRRNPVITGWHGYNPETEFHKSDLNPEHVSQPPALLSKFNSYVKSTRIRVRAVARFSPLAPRRRGKSFPKV